MVDPAEALQLILEPAAPRPARRLPLADHLTEEIEDH